MGLTNEPKSSITAFVKKMGMNYPIGTESKTGQDYGVRGIPRAFIISPEGKVLWTGYPSSQMDRAIESALKNHPPELIHPDTRKKIDGLLAKADSAIEQGDLKGAAEHVAEAVRTDEDGVLQSEMNQRQEAIQNARQNLLQTAEAANHAGRKVQAMKLYKQALEVLARDSEEFQTALQATKALSSDPEYRAQEASAKSEEEAERLYKLGQSAEESRQLTRALTYYKSAVSKYKETEYGRKSAERLDSLKGNKELMTKANTVAQSRQLKRLMASARNWEVNGRPDLAKKEYKKIIEIEV